MSNHSSLVWRGLDDLQSATAREVAEHLDISVSSARRWLEQFVSDGRATMSRVSALSDSTGREVNVHQYDIVAQASQARVAKFFADQDASNKARAELGID